ncbi:MAG: hypothetical protein HQM06_01115 [Magnetococcales bacterium]|nr:hypothetical protein [Magnetococcales bacterium]
MRIFLCQDAVEDQSEWHHLDMVAYRISEGYHIWDAASAGIIEGSAWLQSLTNHLPNYLLLLQKAAAHALYSTTLHSKRITVTTKQHAHPLALSPAHAAKLLNKPLTILVENRFSDALFLKSVLQRLAPPELIEYCQSQPEAIVCDSPGGRGELPKTIEDYATNSMTNSIPIRLVVIVDNEGNTADHRDRIANKIIDLCTKHNIPYHILKKRAIENYIPDKLWENHATTREQADKEKINEFIKSDKTTHDFHDIKKQFGKKSVDLFAKYHQHLTADNLRLRDGEGELDQIVAMIVKEV